MTKFFTRLASLLLALTLWGAGGAMAQSEPSMAQIYSTAASGRLDDAQVMVQQVLISHPKSAKAHYVRAELYARQGRLELARESLATAEKLAPGLPFAKPESVESLRQQLTVRTSASSSAALPTIHEVQAPAKPTPWLVPLLVVGGLMVGSYFFFRRRDAMGATEGVYPGLTANGLNGPQWFGAGPTPAPAGGAPAAYGPGYPAGTPQPAAPGLGSRIAGGVATGLAVGAGVMAAEAIGRSLMGGHSGSGVQHDNFQGGFEPVQGAGNVDMGGSNFGISDTAWDDAGGSDVGGSDWDN